MGLNQEAMSKRVGMGIVGWKTLESEGRAPKGEVLYRLMEMGFSVDWLISGEGSMKIEKSPASKRLREIFDVLGLQEVPVSTEKLTESEELSSIKADLEVISQDPRVDEATRASADMLLKIGFGDPSAAARAEERFKSVARELRRAKAVYDHAVAIAEWVPPRTFAESIKSLISIYKISLQDAAEHIEALKADWLADKHKM